MKNATGTIQLMWLTFVAHVMYFLGNTLTEECKVICSDRKHISNCLGVVLETKEGRMNYRWAQDT